MKTGQQIYACHQISKVSPAQARWPLGFLRGQQYGDTRGLLSLLHQLCKQPETHLGWRLLQTWLLVVNEQKNKNKKKHNVYNYFKCNNIALVINKKNQDEPPWFVSHWNKWIKFDCKRLMTIIFKGAIYITYSVFFVIVAGFTPRVPFPSP